MGNPLIFTWKGRRLNSKVPRMQVKVVQQEVAKGRLQGLGKEEGTDTTSQAVTENLGPHHN